MLKIKIIMYKRLYKKKWMKSNNWTYTIFATLICILLTQCGKKSYFLETQIETIELSYREFWNTRSSDLEDWQILNRPTEMIFGPFEELIISDTRNARVCRISYDGELIEVIGRQGQGPGEFQEPYDLAFDSEKSILWVIDRSGPGKISRFNISAKNSIFLDRINSSLVWLSTPAHGMVLQDGDAFWFSSRHVETRLQLLDNTGRVIKAVGDLMVDPNIDRGELWIHNQTHISDAGSDFIAVAWMLSPKIELWSREGKMVIETELDLPESRLKREQEKAGETPIYSSSIAYDVVHNSIVYQAAYNAQSVVIYLLSVDSLSPTKRFVCAFPREVRFTSLISDYKEGQVRFFALDRREGSVFELSALNEGR